MEVEFKFQVPASRLKRLTAELRTGDVESVRMQARYCDTPDGALARHGLVLRLRKEGDRWLQTVKGQGSGPLARLEDNVSIDVQGDAVPDADLTRHEGTDIGRLLAKAARGGDRRLVELFRTDIVRLRRRDPEGQTLIELALDTGEVLAGGSDGAGLLRSPVCEFELELIRGDVRDLVTTANRWVQRHGLYISDVSKAARGARLLAQEPLAAAKAVPPDYGSAGIARLSGGDVQRIVIAACLAQVIPNASEVAAGSEDVDVVHQLRVGLRRLRTALRELSALSGDGFDPAWEPELRRAFVELGRSRDRELLQTRMLPMLEEAGGPSIVLAEDPAPSNALADAVRATPFQRVLVGLLGFATGEADEGSAKSDSGKVDTGGKVDKVDKAGKSGKADEFRIDSEVREVLALRLNRLHRQIVKGGRQFESLSADGQHQVRKRLKRLRYLAEFVGSLFDAKAARKYIENLTPAQDALGRLNDQHAAEAALRELAETHPSAWFGVGWLAASHARLIKQSRRALEPMGDARRFWK